MSAALLGTPKSRMKVRKSWLCWSLLGFPGRGSTGGVLWKAVLLPLPLHLGEIWKGGDDAHVPAVVLQCN